MANEEKLKFEFTTYLMSEKGIVGKEEVDAEIEKIYKAMPEEVRSEFGEDHDTAAAYYYKTYYASQEGGAQHIDSDPSKNDLQIQDGQSGIIKKNEKKKETDFISPELSAAQSEALEKTLGTISVEDRKTATATSKIVKVLVANPHPSTFLKGVKVVPTCDPTKLKEYEANLVPDSKNKQAFEDVKNAIAKQTPVDAHITKSFQKVEGVIIDTPKAGGKSNELQSEIFTNSTLISFLVRRVFGKIPSNPIGVKLSKFKAVETGKATAGANGQLGRPTLKYARKKLAFSAEGAQYLDTLNTQRTAEEAKKNKKDEFTNKKVGIEPTFEVITERDAKGAVTKTKTVRLKGAFAKYPVFDRKAAYIDTFGAIDDRDTISGTVTDSDILEHEKYTKNIISAALTDSIAMKVSSFGKDFKTLMEAASKAGNVKEATSFE